MNKNFLRLLCGLMLTLSMSACSLLDVFLSANVTIPCNISPRLPDHPVAKQMPAPVGEYPIWFVTTNTIKMSDLGPSLPPYNGGTVRKSLVVVATDLQGDLVITGHQLDGDGVVLFPLQIDEEFEDENGINTIIYSADDLSEREVIPHAQKEEFGTWAKGYTTHPWAAYYPAPGCYQITGTYDGYSTHITVEVRDE